MLDEGQNGLLRCFLSLQSDAEKEDEAFESEKSSPACTCVPSDGGSPSCYSNVWVLFFRFAAAVMFFPCVAGNSRGKMDLVSFLQHTHAQQHHNFPASGGGST